MLLHVNVFALAGIKSSIQVITFGQLIDNDGALESSVLANRLCWDAARVLDDSHTNVLVEVLTLESVELFAGVEKGRAAANDDTFFRGSASSAERVLDAILKLADFDL